jgi:hypothetical protein
VVISEGRCNTITWPRGQEGVVDAKGTSPNVEHG